MIKKYEQQVEKNNNLNNYIKIYNLIFIVLYIYIKINNYSDIEDITNTKSLIQY